MSPSIAARACSVLCLAISHPTTGKEPPQQSGFGAGEDTADTAFSGKV